MVDFKKVGTRIAARKVAEDIFNLLEVPEDYGEDWAEALIEKLTELLPKQPPKEIKSNKKIPISRLGTTIIEFGKHKGKTFDDIPLDYLNWLFTQYEYFIKHLNQYLNHPDLEQYRRGLDK